MTIQTVGDEKVLEQIEKQLHKLVDVLRVSELGQGAHVEREIMLVKIQASGYGREEVKRNTEIFRGQIIDVYANAVYRSTGGHQRQTGCFSGLAARRGENC
ncbi:Acetolactate synthase small subunit [Salmonella enterica subsp. enterica]|uniref:Acetolactate synthase small subunit n=1 Tax=Salmonella enterica I TaxID=59201 RepID=A0A379X012_SALET|nr:Acetolactate synthase small subunit [Salmonella enterica subsp. enterica]